MVVIGNHFDARDEIILDEYPSSTPHSSRMLQYGMNKHFSKIEEIKLVT